MDIPGMSPAPAHILFAYLYISLFNKFLLQCVYLRNLVYSSYIYVNNRYFFCPRSGEGKFFKALKLRFCLFMWNTDLVSGISEDDLLCERGTREGNSNCIICTDFNIFLRNLSVKVKFPHVTRLI